MKKSSLILSVIGLGYVGLPLAIELARNFKTIGYDINSKRLKSINKYKDFNNDISKRKIKNTLNKTFFLANDLNFVNDVNVIIVTLPTPIKKNNVPDISNIIHLTAKIANTINKKQLIIYESTFYPGLIRDKLIPIFEKEGLILNKDFSIGYSPERINPGDKNNDITTIKKIISGTNKEAISLMKNIYGSFVKPGLHIAQSIEIAEAAKVIENTQRDVNIALINEFAKIFEKMNISTTKVLEAAATKWNFLNFSPGLVGGHCIGVDPYYLAYKAKQYGYEPSLILSGRKINNEMNSFVCDKINKIFRMQKFNKSNSNILILGSTFKENCPDVRNSQVFPLVSKLLKSYNVSVYDPYISNKDYKYFKNLKEIQLKKYQLIAILVPHKYFKIKGVKFIKNLLSKDGVVFDFKNLFKNEKLFIRL